jgi:hypothetical protein
MSKIRDLLIEEVNPFLMAWEDSYRESRKLKDALGMLMADEEAEDISQYKELLKIVSDLDKFYAQNTKKVLKLTK